MKSNFTNQFEHWSHDGENYTLDAIGKTMRYVNNEKKNIVAEIKVTDIVNNSNIYSVAILNLTINEVVVKNESIRNKSEAFNILARYMNTRDNTYLHQDE